MTKMSKYPKNYSDVEYYAKNRKRKIAGSTVATNSYLVIVYEENPSLTINELRELIMDRSKYIYNPEAVKVLDAHIKEGYGDCVPDWR